MPINSTQSQKQLVESYLSPTQKITITGSIQNAHSKESIGIDIRKFFSPRKAGDNKEWLPTKKGIWLDLEQLKKLVSMLISNSDMIPGVTEGADVDKWINHDILDFLNPDIEHVQKL